MEDEIVRNCFEEEDRRTRLKVSKFLMESGLIVLIATNFPFTDRPHVLDTLPVAAGSPFGWAGVMQEIQ